MSGFFGVISRSDCVSDLYYGTDYHSHLGTRKGGMAVFDGRDLTRVIHSLENSYFRTKFESDLPKFKGHSGIGVISDTESQPIIVHSHLGRFGIVTVARINNLQELTERALSHRRHFSEISPAGTNPTELAAMLITEEERFEQGILNVYNKIRGSCSMLLITEQGLFAARDKFGRTPVIIGRKQGAYAVASETCAFPNLGYEPVKYLGPGEVVLITPEGYEVRRKAQERMQICAFLWVYYGYPSSSYEDIAVEECRYRCGAALAKNDPHEVDYASGVPDSGIAHAVGYANEKKIPYRRAYVKYTPTWPRSFMPQSQEVRDLVARMKLMPNRSLIKNQRIALCDDSIVRGTQLQDNVQVLYKCGAKEVHIRPACPTLIFPCEFLNFSTSRSTLDLAGRKAIREIEGTEDVNFSEYADPDSGKCREMVERIRQNLGVTSLQYQRLDDLVKAIGLPKNKLCTHCWDGTST
ncbi:MAG: amidophosphoribosyltransferase [Bacteroidales bacterium]|nr:amidophosphoribosyltransferase [Bacteroidales bacterium]